MKEMRRLPNNTRCKLRCFFLMNIAIGRRHYCFSLRNKFTKFKIANVAKMFVVARNYITVQIEALALLVVMNKQHMGGLHQKGP